MTKQIRWYSGVTQVYWTCKALIDGRPISHKIEIREVKGWRLEAIVAHYRFRTGTDNARLHVPPSAKALAQGGTP